MGIELLLLLGLGAIALVLLTKKKEPPPPPPPPSDYPQLLKVELYHVGGGIGFLEVSATDSDDVTRLVSSSAIHPTYPTGLSTLWSAPPSVAIKSVTVDVRGAAQSSNQIIFTFAEPVKWTPDTYESTGTHIIMVFAPGSHFQVVRVRKA